MDRVIVITGASGGIGAATALALARRGAKLGLVARRAKVLHAVAEACGHDALPIVADMARRDEVRGVRMAALARFGRIDVWINNVGQGITRQPSELTDADLDAMIRANVRTALYGMQEILPHFKERGRGHIINVSSILGRMPLKTFRSAYNGAKHFLNALTANFRDEIHETHPGIHVTLVSPGVVRTDFGNHALHGGPDSRQIADSQSADEVAEVLVRLIESPRADVYTQPGTRERVMGYLADLTADP
jgi:short-subunit dehydrogenase